MRLWNRANKLKVTDWLRIGKNATFELENSAGAVTTITQAEMAYIDGQTAGTVTASKAVVVDSNKDIGDFRNLDVVNLDAGASGTAGSVDVFPTTASKGKLALTCTDQTGDTTVSLVAGAMSAARTITIRDPGAAASLLTTTDSTAAAVAATALEINRVCDASARIVTSTATALSLTLTEHGERIVVVNTNSTVANTFTLPVAAGTGAKFTLLNNVVQTQGTVVFAANGTDVMQGFCTIIDSTGGGGTKTFATSATSDKMSMNLTTTGGLGGDILEAWDISANTWLVMSTFQGSGTLATPFSAT